MNPRTRGEGGRPPLIQTQEEGRNVRGRKYRKKTAEEEREEEEAKGGGGRPCQTIFFREEEEPEIDRASGVGRDSTNKILPKTLFLLNM